MLLIRLLEIILFVCFSVNILYLLVFSIASVFGKREKREKEAVSFRRVAILVPAYKEDRVIMECVESCLRQNYPHDRYDVVVISDRMEAVTNGRLSALPLILEVVRFENSTKAKALNLAMSHLSGYDLALILDADNTIGPDYLNQVNAAPFNGNIVGYQTHRTAKNKNTSLAYLDAVSEEINNGFFRSGHNAVRLSAALSGSGMVIAEQNFRRYVLQLKTTGEDKELEALILKESCGLIAYISDLPVYDEKTQRQEAISNQRRRWIAAQFGALRASLPEFPKALIQGNRDY